MDSSLPASSAYFAISAVALLLWSIITIVYRLCFHSLSHFPGPKLAALTFLYENYYDVFKSPGGQYMYDIDRLHDVYGPVVRVSPEEIHIKDSQWMDTLLSGPGHVRDKSLRTNRANMSTGSVASAQSHHLHRARRGALNRYFSKRAVTQLEDMIQEKTELLCRRLCERADRGEVVELGAALLATTMDIISEYCYGHDASWNILDTPDLGHQWQIATQSGFAGTPLRRCFPGVMKIMMSIPKWMVKRLSPSITLSLSRKALADIRSRQSWNDFYEHEAEKGQSDDKAKTVFHGILASKLPPEEKTVERLADEAFVLVMAGSETTAKVQVVILVKLLQDPGLLARLRQELDPVMKRGPPNVNHLEQLPLLSAVIEEGLRLTAPVTNRPTLVAPEEDLQYKEWLIPRGTPISMSFEDVLHDPAIFPEPNTFNPDRWLRAKEQGRRFDAYQVAFGKGSRSCVGLNLAYAELYLVIAVLVTRFDLELYDFQYDRDLKTVRDGFVGLPSKESKGVRVQLTRRAGS